MRVELGTRAAFFTVSFASFTTYWILTYVCTKDYFVTQQKVANSTIPLLSFVKQEENDWLQRLKKAAYITWSAQPAN